MNINSSIGQCDNKFGWDLTVRKIGGTRVLVPGHQNSGAPTFFSGFFLMVFSHLCWQCSDKTRKCQEHKNTLRKKEKLIFLMPILEIKTKNLFSAGKGTRVLVPGHQNYGAPTLRIHNKENTNKLWGPEFWCPGTRTLVPFQVENSFFVLISRMGFRNINFCFFLSVFLCS